MGKKGAFERCLDREKRKGANQKQATYKCKSKFNKK